MALRADVKYNGVIGSGAYFSYSVNGNLGFQIPITCDDGQTWFTLWLTEKNRVKATGALIMLGADQTKLASQSYLENFLPGAIAGKEISFGTKEDEYNGKISVKVAWIGKKTDPNVAKGAASFFGGVSPEPVRNDEPLPSVPINGNDIPF
jgi:hypothetical protein